MSHIVATGPDTTTATSAPETPNGPDLTDELAEVLTAVADNSLDLDSDPADDTQPAWRQRVATEKRAARLAALSLLAHIGYVNPILDGTWAIETAGNDALAARRAAVEAEGRRKVADSYQAVAAELHAIADALAGLPTDALMALSLELRIQTAYAREEVNAVKVATVDAVAGVLFGAAAVTNRLGSSDTWQHVAEGRRGPVKVEVYGFVKDPTAREREQAEQERVAEVERLKAERLKAELAERDAELATLRSDESGGAA